MRLCARAQAQACGNPQEGRAARGEARSARREGRAARGRHQSRAHPAPQAGATAARSLTAAPACTPLTAASTGLQGSYGDLYVPQKTYEEALDSLGKAQEEPDLEEDFDIEDEEKAEGKEDGDGGDDEGEEMEMEDEEELEHEFVEEYDEDVMGEDLEDGAAISLCCSISGSSGAR